MVARNAVSKKVCRGLIEECKRYFEFLFESGVTMGGFDPFIKLSSDFSFSTETVINKEIYTANFSYYEKEISVAMYSAIAQYIQSYPQLWRWPKITDTGFRLQRYFQNSGYYRTHVDATPWDDLGGRGPRVLGVIIYLNTVDVGGTTYFRAHDVHIPAVEGSIALFPTNWTHPHEGQVPISSDKWMISSFMLTERDLIHIAPESAENDQVDAGEEKMQSESLDDKD